MLSPPAARSTSQKPALYVLCLFLAKKEPLLCFFLVFPLLLAIVDDVLPIKKDWMAKMGDKPTPRDPTIHCFNSFWKDGRMADYCIATFFGIEPNTEFPPPMPKYIGGSHICMLSPSCNYWDSTQFIPWLGGMGPAASIYNDDGNIKVWLFTSRFPYYAFANNNGALPQQDFGNQNSGDDVPYYGGSCHIEWFFNGQTPPLSWAAASAAGVPASKGYLAEQGYSGLDDNHYRYCAAHNKTNIKVIMGVE